MDAFDNTLIKVYNFFENSIVFLKKVIGQQFVESVFNLFDRLFAVSFLISAGLLFLSSLVGFVKYDISLYIFAMFLGPIFVLLLGYLSEAFHEACTDSLKSNPTSLSNEAYLKFSGVINFIFAVIVFLAGIYILIENPMNFDTYTVALVFVFAFYLLISTAPYFNPELINLNVDKNSSAGDDVIGITSFGLKSLVFQERLLSRILIIIASVYLLVSMFSDMGIIYFPIGLGFLVGGILLPLVVYFIFILFFFVNSLLQAILHIPKLNK